MGKSSLEVRGHIPHQDTMTNLRAIYGELNALRAQLAAASAAGGGSYAAGSGSSAAGGSATAPADDKGAPAPFKGVALLADIHEVDAVVGDTLELLATPFDVELFMIVVTVEAADTVSACPEIALEVVAASADVCEARSIGQVPANLVVGKRYVFEMSELMAGLAAGETLLARFATAAAATTLTLGFKVFGYQA